MPFFTIVIPNYNNEPWLGRCLGSIKGQSFKDYEAFFVDDCSTDGSFKVVLDMANRNIVVHGLKSKRYNGGSRNYGLQKAWRSEYTLFLDSDDWFVDNNVLQDLHDFIVAKGCPDCIRLPYRFEYDGNKTGSVPLNDDTPEKLVNSVFVACWTKCIKSELVQPFPENTLMEDVVQHIKQCDVIKDVVPFTRPVVTHNKNNANSCTKKENVEGNKKWRSSMYRYMADLIDLELEHDYCEKQRESRAIGCQRNIEKGVYTQSGWK